MAYSKPRQLDIYIYIYIYIYRERERERERQTDRDTERDRQIEIETDRQIGEAGERKPGWQTDTNREKGDISINVYIFTDRIIYYTHFVIHSNVIFL